MWRDHLNWCIYIYIENTVDVDLFLVIFHQETSTDIPDAVGHLVWRGFRTWNAWIPGGVKGKRQISKLGRNMVGVCGDYQGPRKSWSFVGWNPLSMDYNFCIFNVHYLIQFNVQAIPEWFFTNIQQDCLVWIVLTTISWQKRLALPLFRGRVLKVTNLHCLQNPPRGSSWGHGLNHSDDFWWIGQVSGYSSCWIWLLSRVNTTWGKQMVKWRVCLGGKFRMDFKSSTLFGESFFVMYM